MQYNCCIPQISQPRHTGLDQNERETVDKKVKAGAQC